MTDRTKGRSARNEAWQHFWQSERTESCVPVNPATQQELAEQWQEFFAGLPAESRILDIATGNGALLRLAATVNTCFFMHGVDLADIDPLRHAPDGLGNANVTFHGGIDAVDLPFETDGFDVVISQYGLEYAELGPAVAELARVLRPNGQLRWLAHTPDSEVVTQNVDQHRQVDFLLAQHGPVDAMGQLTERIRRQKSVKITMSRLNRALGVAEAFCREHPSSGIVAELCQGFMETAGRWQAYDPADLKAMVDHARRELIAHRQRILDLNDAVLTEDRESAVRESLSGPGWSNLSIEALTVGKEPIGCWIAARRAGESADV